MLKKQDAIPGTRIKITKNPLTSVWAVDKNGNQYIEGFPTYGLIYPDSPVIPIYTGDTAVITSAPRRYYPGGTVVGIKPDRCESENDPELFCFWVQIYRNAEKI